MDKPKRIFISYSHKDLKWKDILVKHLKALEMEGLCTLWDDTKISPGDQWLPAIKQALNESQIFILLISANSLVSTFILQEEFPTIINSRQKEGAHVFPIIIKHCAWQQVKWLSELKVVPESGKPLSSYTNPKRESILVDLTIEINKILVLSQKTTMDRPLEEEMFKTEAFESTATEKEDGKEEEPGISTLRFEIPAAPNIHDMDHKPVIGAKELAGELADLLNSQCSDKAMMVGLFGQWGRGKTFLMEQIWDALKSKKDKNNFVRVDFHAWKYQDTPASWAYLYEAFTSKYFSLPERKDYEKSKTYYRDYFRGKTRNFFRLVKVNGKRHGWLPLIYFCLSVVGYIYLASLGIATKIESIYKIIGLISSAPLLLYISTKVFFRYRKKAIQLFKKYSKKKSYNELLGIQKEIQDELKILLKAWISEKKLARDKKILLVVDDLDRCRDERLIQIIDSMRVMLEDESICRRVVALIAVDERILTRAIRFKYHRIINQDAGSGSNELPIDKLTREYLDKLFLIGIKLNPLHASEKSEILDTLAEGRIAPGDETRNEEASETSEPPSGSEDADPDSPLPEVTSNKENSENPDQSEEKFYKITRHLFAERKAKKLLKPYLEDLKTLMQRKEVYNRERLESILDKEMKIPPEIIEQILPHMEFQPDISKDEYKRLQELLPLLQNATPRNIRILYYQYILAKRLLKNDSKLYDSLYQEKSRTSFLIDLLFAVCIYRSTLEMAKLRHNLSNSNFDEIRERLKEKCPENEDICRNMVSNLEKFTSDQLNRLLKLLEVVVAY